MLQAQLNKIRVNNIDIHYVDIGEGDAVVFIHGGGATDYRTWNPVIDRFTQRYRVVIPSLRYHYPNPWGGDGLDYSAETHAKDMAALIQAIGLAPGHVAGSSMGANIGLVLARDYPDSVRTLVLGEPALPDWLPETEADDRERDVRSREVIRQAATNGDFRTAVRLSAERVIGPGAFDRFPEATRQRMMDNARLLSLPESAYRNSLGMFSRKDASSITHPTLLLRGDLSPKQFLLAEAELAKYLPDAERVLIPNAAHVLHGMNPEVYSDVVLSFLAKH